jgi:hypothetical protein
VDWGGCDLFAVAMEGLGLGLAGPDERVGRDWNALSTSL